MKLSMFKLHEDDEMHAPEPPPAPSDSPDAAPAVPELTPRGRPVLLGDVRRHILDRLLMAAGGMGILVYLADLPLLVRNSQWLVIISTTLIVTALLWAAIDRRLAYRLRVTLLLVGLFGAGASTLIGDGLLGSGRVFLISLPFIAAIFASGRGRVGWALLSVGMVVFTGVAMISGWIEAPGLRPGSGNASVMSWVVATANFSLLAVAGTASLGLLLEGLETSLRQQHILSRELESERERLELRVQARTQDLERRVVQIRTAAEITGTLSRAASVGSMGIDALLAQVCELVRDRYNLYYVGVFLIEAGRPGDEAEGYAILKAGTGEAGRAMLDAGHRLAVGGDSMIGWTCEHQQARIALDVGAEAVRFNNPFLPRTRSELALPLVVSEAAAAHTQPTTRTLGAVTIQSTQEAAFDQDDITALQGIADTLANAIMNARLFAAMQASLDEVETLHRQYLEGAWSRETALHELSYTYVAGANTPDQPAPADPDSQPLIPALEVPIQLRNQVIGDLVLEAEPGAALREWTAEDVALVQAVASQAALALETARLLEETQRTAETERTVAAITSKLWATSNVDTILTTTLNELAASLEARTGSIELWPAQPPAPATPTPQEGSHADA